MKLMQLYLLHKSQLKITLANWNYLQQERIVFQVISVIIHIKIVSLKAQHAIGFNQYIIIIIIRKMNQKLFLNQLQVWSLEYYTTFN